VSKIGNKMLSTGSVKNLQCSRSREINIYKKKNNTPSLRNIKKNPLLKNGHITFKTRDSSLAKARSEKKNFLKVVNPKDRKSKLKFQTAVKKKDSLVKRFEGINLTDYKTSRLSNKIARSAKRGSITQSFQTFNDKEIQTTVPNTDRLPSSY